MSLSKSWSMNRSMVAMATAALVLAAAPLAAQVSAPGNNKPLPASAQKAPPFQGGGGGFNAVLEGEYIYSGAGACVFAPSGFNENFQPISFNGSFTNAFSVNGLRVFNGDGTGTMDARAMSVSSGGGNSNRFVGDFTYEVGTDLTITITSESSTTFILTGPLKGQTQVLHGPIVMKGRISEDLRTIHVMQYDPQVETITTLNGEFLNQRICYRERTMTRLKRAQ